jgi:hypothetical protein
MTRKDFQILSRMRLRDARTLLRSGNIEGAYYLSGLAVECTLKSAIARKTQRHDFPPEWQYVKDKVYTHSLNNLLVTAGLAATLEKAVANNAGLKTNWAIVKDWKVESRYQVGGLNGNALYQAVAGQDGVLKWLRQYW